MVKQKIILTTPFFILLYLISFNACSSGNVTMEKQEITCEKPIQQTAWMKKSFKYVVEKLGPPSSEEEFNMEDALMTEFRGNLENLFPKNNVERKKILVKEALWKQGECNLTLWFKKSDKDWDVIDTLYWHKDTEF